MSDVQETSSTCINKLFPTSDHIIIDGRSGWFYIWYKWLDIASTIESDWYIYVDEDCFITDDTTILKLIKYMEDNNYDIAGQPDGCCEYRSCNYMAFNSYFMIMNKKCIDVWQNRKTIPQFKKEWIKPYPFEKRNDYTFIYDMEFGTSKKPVNMIWKAGSEPYYDFFWVLKDNNINFYYIEPFYDENFQASVLLNHSVMHMWYQRQRYCDYNVCPIMHNGSNKKRFDDVLKYIKNEMHF